MPKIDKKKPESLPTPAIRLATGVDPPDAFAKGLGPDVRLAAAGGENKKMYEDGGAVSKGLSTEATHLPALLVSYYYLQPFLENKHRYHYRDWVLDSGAFSAHNSGVEIVLQDYIDCCKKLMAEDPTLTEVYSLDVIGDWKGSLKNTEEMWKQGVPAIPCFHANEPWHALTTMAKEFPKIALGGVALAKGGKKLGWAAQCFARVWPKKIHGFAFGSEKAIMTLPFHSVDATNWEIGPCKFGRWAAFGNAQISVRGSQQNLRAEVEWYLELERKARTRWKKEMAQLEALGPVVRLAETASGKTAAKIRAMEAIANEVGPAVRLATANLNEKAYTDKYKKALGGPDVRLALGGEGHSGESKRAGQIAKATQPRERET